MNKSILLSITGMFLFFVQHSFSQSTQKVPTNNFHLSYTDIERKIYVFPTKEGGSVLNLYMDSLFSLHTYNATDKKGVFSAGQWSISNDSVLVLKSDSALTCSIFKRSKRSNTLAENAIVPLFITGILRGREYIYFRRFL